MKNIFKKLDKRYGLQKFLCLFGFHKWESCNTHVECCFTCAKMRNKESDSQSTEYDDPTPIKFEHHPLENEDVELFMRKNKTTPYDDYR